MRWWSNSSCFNTSWGRGHCLMWAPDMAAGNIMRNHEKYRETGNFLPHPQFLRRFLELWTPNCLQKLQAEFYRLVWYCHVLPFMVVEIGVPGSPARAPWSGSPMIEVQERVCSPCWGLQTSQAPMEQHLWSTPVKAACFPSGNDQVLTPQKDTKRGMIWSEAGGSFHRCMLTCGMMINGHLRLSPPNHPFLVGPSMT